jgi:hypothetical protein
MRRLLPICIASGIAFGAFAPSAAGSAFYNDTGSDGPNIADLYFVCGSTCHNEFSIKAGDSMSRPKQAGHFWLLNVGGFKGKDGSACQLNTNSVSSSGWGSLHYDGGYNWAIYGNDQDPVSGSPFPLVFAEYKDQQGTVDTGGCGG